jgi:hypothetical protein
MSVPSRDPRRWADCASEDKVNEPYKEYNLADRSLAMSEEMEGMGAIAKAAIIKNRKEKKEEEKK